MLFILLEILLLLLSLWFVFFVHELGHLLVGKIYGWKLVLFICGPIGLKRKNDNINNRLVPYCEKRLLQWGGRCYVLPKNIGRLSAKVLSHIVIGGPIASLIFGASFLFVAYFIFPLGIFRVLGLLSTLTGIITLIPTKIGMQRSDGLAWMRLRSGRSEQAEEMALQKLSMYELKVGNLILAREHFEALLESKDFNFRYMGYHYSYVFHKLAGDKENAERVRALAEEISHKVSPGIKTVTNFE